MNREPTGEPTVALRPDFYTLRIEVEEEAGGRVWRAVRLWRSSELPDFVLYEEASPAVVFEP